MFICCHSVTKSCLTLCNPINCSTLGSHVLHYLLKFTQTHVHWVGDAMSPSYPLLPLSPPALSLSQHQGLFQWAGSSHQVAKVLKLQLQQQWKCSSSYYNEIYPDIFTVTLYLWNAAYQILGRKGDAMQTLSLVFFSPESLRKYWLYEVVAIAHNLLAEPRNTIHQEPASALCHFNQTARWQMDGRWLYFNNN